MCYVHVQDIQTQMLSTSLTQKTDPYVCNDFQLSSLLCWPVYPLIAMHARLKHNLRVFENKPCVYNKQLNSYFSPGSSVFTKIKTTFSNPYTCTLQLRKL